MLEPDGRSLLLDSLRPPEGYRLDYGVATTFTLHLDTALSVPLSFLSRRLADSGDPIALMEAVRAAADRLDVFHQAGMIAMPPSRSPIFSFLEPVLHAVRRPKAGHLFHPKLWVLRYLADDDASDVRMRLIVPSRNLTADRSWDLCLQLDGQLSPEPLEINGPIADLLTALPGMCLSAMPPERTSRLDALASDLQRTEWELPEHVEEIYFDVLRPGHSLSDDFFVGDQHLVISPFCTDGGLATVTGGTPATVVSRQESLDALTAGVLDRHEAFVLDPLTSEMEDKGDGAELSATGLTGLHAKCFILRYGKEAWIRVGSANATEAAFNGNVEILVSLVGSAAKLGVLDLFKPESSLRSILTEYSPQTATDEDDVADQLGDLLVDLASGKFTAWVQTTDDGHRVRLQGPGLPPLPAGARVTVRPVTVPEFAAEVPPEQLIDVTFGPMEIDQISAFMIITATTQDGVTVSAVVLADLVGAPENRLDEIIARQVDTPEKFLRFLALLLGMGQPAWAAGMAPAGSAGASAGTAFEAPGLLELLMRALVEHPDRLDDLARLVKRLGAQTDRGSVLPDGFSDIWAVVDAVRQDKEIAA
ncbi:phospholipase D family protein [Modestobacter excelsi]|uniref:phospholipase D family protein n=1 Tax=Modestobacter excelsi TaxID=2213161 RepID=UPI00110D0A7D|nr:phospholipase D family protein [Modestobacter excelsi]